MSRNVAWKKKKNLTNILSQTESREHLLNNAEREEGGVTNESSWFIVGRRVCTLHCDTHIFNMKTCCGPPALHGRHRLSDVSLFKLRIDFRVRMDQHCNQADRAGPGLCSIKLCNFEWTLFFFPFFWPFKQQKWVNMVKCCLRLIQSHLQARAMCDEHITWNYFRSRAEVFPALPKVSSLFCQCCLNQPNKQTQQN